MFYIRIGLLWIYWKEKVIKSKSEEQETTEWTAYIPEWAEDKWGEHTLNKK